LLQGIFSLERLRNVNPCPSDDSCPAECPAESFSGTHYLGTFNGSRYYKKSSGDVNYWTAHNFAESIGGHLITINNAEENNFLKNVTDGKVWLGLSDRDSEGNFTWNNGDPVNYTNWRSEEPNNWNNEDFTRFYSNGKWNDNNEHAQASCVIEIPCDCCTATLEVCNNGNCPVNLYHWVATGDILLTTLNPGQCFDVSTSDHEMYRIVDTNNDWNNLTIDEQYTVAGCEDRTILAQQNAQSLTLTGQITSAPSTGADIIEEQMIASLIGKLIIMQNLLVDISSPLTVPKKTTLSLVLLTAQYGSGLQMPTAKETFLGTPENHSAILTGNPDNLTIIITTKIIP